MKKWLLNSLIAGCLQFSLSFPSNAGRERIMMRSTVSDKKESAFLVANSSPVLLPCIILVNPFLDSNVGSVSRAMLNFGLSDLRIVNPECDILSEEARRLAVGSVELLENAKTFRTIEDAVADLTVVMATTARSRDINQFIHSPASAAEELVVLREETKIAELTAAARHDDADPEATGSLLQGTTANYNTTLSTTKSGILFGREKFGLTNDELTLCDSIISIPTFDHYPVLNLAQAVNIVGYELWKRQLHLSKLNDIDQQKHRVVARNHPQATREEINSFMDRLTSILNEKGYQATSKNNNNSNNAVETTVTGLASASSPSEDNANTIKNAHDAVQSREKAYQTTRIALQRARLSRKEVNMFHGILTFLLSQNEVK